jgi:hypothetical protein
MIKAGIVALLGIIYVGIQAGVALAIHPDSGPGCGLGKIGWAEHKNQKNIAPQVLMSTSNQIGLQSLAISSGTSGCTNDGMIWADPKVTVFASLDLENLAQDMAKGRGEHLASLATLMGVPAEQQPVFFAMTQEKYAMLIQAGETSPAAMIRALNDAMASHPVLAKASTTR